MTTHTARTPSSYRGFLVTFAGDAQSLTSGLPDLLVMKLGPAALFVRTGPTSGEAELRVIEADEPPRLSPQDARLQEGWQIVEECVMPGTAQIVFSTLDGTEGDAVSLELAALRAGPIGVRVSTRGYDMATLNEVVLVVPEEYEMTLFPIGPTFTPQKSGENVWP